MQCAETSRGNVKYIAGRCDSHFSIITKNRLAHVPFVYHTPFQYTPSTPYHTLSTHVTFQTTRYLSSLPAPTGPRPFRPAELVPRRSNEPVRAFFQLLIFCQPGNRFPAAFPFARRVLIFAAWEEEPPRSLPSLRLGYPVFVAQTART